ncbi:MAG: Uncharacterized protein XD58_0420 [Thermotoga sp. 50_1627]|uniref:hypothetical protein n=1 Tax=Pseudothermotoga sp. TaxID=2033661 RepID=UPI00076C4D63|nr:MAG: Uncharacterized protein XD45_0227 [Thermotoga sp. 50_64]KUK25552.1 MAG: Uncharacterized protein XD58_0420 [Thermotoga sp. 50_1627]MBC7116577.1 hypothetical protein [Pseudothermotoga sp.]MDK2922588.1 hypothetical protein [Pseudothermotoga sp.]HBT40251.1 hypothetical protein [Pseudothermotoga sp.]
MRILKCLFLKDAFLKVRETWSFLIALISFNTVIIAFWENFKLVFVGTNLPVKYVELNVVFLIYLFLLCGLTSLRRDVRNALSLPLLFLPYILTPIYAVMLTWFRFPKALSFTIAFVHSILLVSEHDPLVLLVRMSAYVSLITVVRHWI